MSIFRKEQCFVELLNDNNKDCCTTLRKNHLNTNVVCGSMDELNLTEYIGEVELTQ